MKASRAFLLFGSSLLMFASQALAQQATTPVVIAITDPSGAGVSGTQIRVVPAPDPQPKMVTDNKGQLALSLKPGGYALFARGQGFRTLAMHFDVRLQADAQTVTGVVQVGGGGGPTLVAPATSKDDLIISAVPYHEPEAFSPAQIRALPQVKVTVHNPHTNGDDTYSGVRLAELLSKVNAPLGKELRGDSVAIYIIAGGSDGYEALLSLAEVDPEFHPGEVIVADAMNGKPLDEHDGSLKLVVSEDKRPARWVRNLNTIRLGAAQ